MKRAISAALAVLPIAAACGGGSDGPCKQLTSAGWVACTPSTTPPKVDTSIPEGIWGGGTSDGLAVSTLVLETGQYFIVPTSTSGIGLVEGMMSGNNGNISDPAAVIYPASNVPVAGTLSGSFSAKKTLTGTVSASAALSSPFPSGSMSSTFNGNYNSLYDSPATIAEAVGSWTGQTSGSTVTLTVKADGTFTGANSGCTFSGTVSPRSTGKHVLDGKVTFDNSACVLGAGASTTFVAVVNGNQLAAAGVTSQRDHAFVVVATKN
ncbi:hypothetical protein PWP93_35880 [Paraburkholderia sp. A1RI-2L]|uniref:hypothetical protein n=1 Tax=Paraburkholderia sp. A1RI-2L TaxID=3028367 RepID=UPI003B7EED02